LNESKSSGVLGGRSVVKQTELINTIIEAERQAQSLAAEAKQKKLRLREDLKTSVEEIRRKYSDQADKRIMEVQAREDEKTDSAILSVDQAHRAVMDAMEKRYAKSRGAWIEKIYGTIIKPTS